MVGSGWCNKMVWVFFVNLKRNLEIFGDRWEGIVVVTTLLNKFLNPFKVSFIKYLETKMGF